MRGFENPFANRIEGGGDVPSGHEREVGNVKTALKDMAKTIFGGAEITEEMLKENWPKWQKIIEKAKPFIMEGLKAAGFSWDSKVVEHIRTTVGPAEKALFAAARGVLGEYEIELLKTLREYEKEQKQKGA